MLIEQSESVGGDSNYLVAETIPAGAEADEAWTLALETARTHDRYGYARDYTREIYRTPDGALRVLFRKSHGYIAAGFRVSVAELVDVRKPEAPAEGKESGARGLGFGRFRR
ncbi:hypothetical protein ACFQ7A_03805 [Streptomyces sp. NPDC056528]|uniref:hypothetical protein n=1 Tax=Streptomyces sp. NPDC056528 TaxID=3345854 RepID=UPI003690F96A